MKGRLKAITLLIMLAVATTGAAQENLYKFDFGGSIGMSGYLGEANTSSILKHPGFTADINSRYILNTRIAFRGLIGMQTLKGDSSEMENVLPGNAQYKFTATTFDIGVRGEFNFFPYGIGETYKRLRPYTPYLTLGMGVCLSSTGGGLYCSPIIPMGIGVKYKLKPRLNLGVEFTMTKTLGDNLDGENLHDLTGIKTSFIKNTDWYSRLTVGLTYEFGERCETCHYVD